MPKNQKPFAPRPVGNPPRGLTITGHVFAWSQGQPLWVRVYGTSDWFLPVFSTAKKLRRHFTVLGIRYERIKQIQDAQEFLESIPFRMPSGERLRIMVDPWRNEAGNTQFAEVMRIEPDG